MSTLHRLKAYFGMVPADELDEYDSHFGPHVDDDEYESDYDGGYRSRSGSPGPSGGPGPRTRWTDYRDHRDHRDSDDDYYDDEPEVPARRTPVRRSWAAAETPVRGALAVDPAREPHPAVAPPVHAEDVHPLARIITLHPRSYYEARTIGEHYRDGTPVIMNLTALEDADAKRLVDFAAGLAFALRGSMDKITTKVFLISPANVDVTAEDKRRIAEGSFLPSRASHS